MIRGNSAYSQNASQRKVQCDGHFVLFSLRSCSSFPASLCSLGLARSLLLFALLLVFPYSFLSLLFWGGLSPSSPRSFLDVTCTYFSSECLRWSEERESGGVSFPFLYCLDPRLLCSRRRRSIERDGVRKQKRQGRQGK